MLNNQKPFLCTLLCDYPPEDLWKGDGVYAKCNEHGNVCLSLYCVDEGNELGAIFELNACEGRHFSKDECIEGAPPPKVYRVA